MSSTAAATAGAPAAAGTRDATVAAADGHVAPRQLGVVERERDPLATDHDLLVDLDLTAGRRALGDNEPRGHADPSSSAAVRSRSAYAPALCGRASGTFSSAVRTAAANRGSVPARSAVGSGGASSRCASPTWKSDLSANGARPARHSNATQPSA